MSLEVLNPVAAFPDTNGSPLQGGSIYIGLPNVDPTKNPVSVYQDAGLTIPITQPIGTINGQPAVAGTPTQIFLGQSVTTYSIAVFNSAGAQTMSLPNVQPVASAVAAGNMNLDEFISSTLPNPGGLPTFVAGTTTTLTLSAAPGAPQNAFVTFDPIDQFPSNDYGISGNTLTFTSPIPVGTNYVRARYGTTLAIGTPGAGTVTDASVAAGAGIESSKLSYTEGSTGSVAVTVQEQLQQFLFPINFGAVGNGVADDTGALQAFFNEMAATGRPGFLGGSTYNVSQPLTASAPISLYGTFGATIHNTNADATPAVISLSSTAANGSILSGFSITSVSTTTCSGVQIDNPSSYAFLLDRLRISGTFYGISVLANQIGATIRDCYVQNTASHGYAVDAANMTFEGCYAINVGGCGWAFTAESGASAGIVLSDCTNAGSNSHGFYFLGNSTNGIDDVTVTGCVSSTTPNGTGFFFDTYGKNHNLSGCFVEEAGLNGSLAVVSNQNGYHFTQNNHRVTVGNCQATFSSFNGMEMDCGYFSINGGDYTANNIAGQASGSGILVGASGAVNGFTITGVNTVPDVGPDDNSQEYGINLYGTGHTNGAISGCILSGLVAPLAIQSSPTIGISNCPGYVNRNTGIATINAGQTSLNVAHGLSQTPDIVLVSAVSTSPGATPYFSASYGATNFVLELGSAAAGNLSFAWQAICQ
jgi:hypothetical protein